MKRLLSSHPIASFLTAVVIVLVIIAVDLLLITAPKYSFVWGSDGISHARSGKFLAIYASLIVIVPSLMLIASIWVWVRTKNSLIWRKVLARIFSTLIALVALIIIYFFLLLALMPPGIYDKDQYRSDLYEKELHLVETRSCVDCSFWYRYEFVNKDLQGVDLTGADLSEMNLDGVNFSGANLTGADFGYASLTGTDFTDADLTGVRFKGEAYRSAIYCNTTTNMVYEEGWNNVWLELRNKDC